MPPDRTNTTTVMKCAKQTTLDQMQRFRSIEQNSPSLFNLSHQRTADRVFIGGGSPTNPRNYTVMPPNNYILGIFQGQGRIFTSRSGLQLDFYCSSGPASLPSRGAASAVVLGSSPEFFSFFAWLCQVSSPKGLRLFAWFRQASSPEGLRLSAWLRLASSQGSLSGSSQGFA